MQPVPSNSPHGRSRQYQQSEGDRPRVRTEEISPAQSQQRWRMYGATFQGGNGQREDSLPVVLKMEASKIKFFGIIQTHSKQVTSPFKTRPTYPICLESEFAFEEKIVFIVKYE